MKRFWILLGSVVCLAGATCALAYSAAPPTTIVSYSIGWDQPNLSVVTAGAIFNPDNCTDTSAYMVPYNSPALQQFTAAVISAQATHRTVSVVVNGCTSNRPQMVGINVS